MQFVDYFIRKGIVLDAAQEQILETSRPWREMVAKEVAAFAKRKTRTPLFSCFSPPVPFRKKKILGGIYLHGEVGRGKTMLMDFVESSLRTPLENVTRREHFYAFMRYVHQQIFLYRQQHFSGKTFDPTGHVAKTLAKDTKLLFLDEMQVRDIADASLLEKLLRSLYARGVYVLITSNIAPRDLYKDGLHHDRFAPCIQLLEEHFLVLNLDSGKDYRLAGEASSVPHFLRWEDQTSLETLFAQRTKHKATPEKLLILARQVEIPLQYGELAYFSFAQLCQRSLSPIDYAVIAKTYREIYVDHVPVMDESQRDSLLRFVAMVDVFYEAKITLWMRTQTELERLCASPKEEMLFKRTLSRLHEMGSERWTKEASKSPK